MYKNVTISLFCHNKYELFLGCVHKIKVCAECSRFSIGFRHKQLKYNTWKPGTNIVLRSVIGETLESNGLIFLGYIAVDIQLVFFIIIIQCLWVKHWWKTFKILITTITCKKDWYQLVSSQPLHVLFYSKSHLNNVFRFFIKICFFLQSQQCQF